MIKLHILTVALVLVGALDSVSNITGTNFVERLGNNTHKNVSTVIYAIIGICCLYLLFDRNTYLPFLGESVFPCGVLNKSTPDKANKVVKIKTRPNTMIVYWAAEPNVTNERNPQEAYAGYKNSGVTQSDKNGDAELHVRKPIGYRVPMKKLQSHIHYRECINGYMLDEVKTIFV